MANTSLAPPRRRVQPGDAAEDGAGHEPSAAGVIVEEETAGDFAGGVEAGDRMARGVLDLGIVGDLEAAEGEGDAGRHGVGLVGRPVEALGPVGLVNRETARRQPVADVGVERYVGAWGGVEGPHRVEETARVDAFELLGQGLEGVGLFFGDARDAVFLAQQMRDLLVEDLPGEHAGLVQDLAAVFGVGVAVEIEPLVEETLAAGVDDDAERVIVLLEAVADIEVAKGRRVEIPGDGMRAGPVPGDGSAEVERHLQPLAGVETRAAHLGEVPVGPEISGPHLGIGLEAAAGEDHRLGAQVMNAAPMAHPHALDAAVALQETDRRGLVEHSDPVMRGARVQRLHQFLAAAPDMAGETAPEFELAVDPKRLPAEPELETDALAAHPHAGLEAIADQDLGHVRVAAELGEATHIVEILLLGVGPEIDVPEFGLVHVRDQLREILTAVIDDAKRAAGEGGVAAARLLGGDLQHQHPGAVLLRRQCGASRGIARPDDDDVELFAPEGFHGLILSEAGFSRSRITWRTKPSGSPNTPPRFATRICPARSWSRPKIASSILSRRRSAARPCRGAASSSTMPSAPGPAANAISSAAAGRRCRRPPRRLPMARLPTPSSSTA